jgi:hypothetical protein
MQFVRGETQESCPATCEETCIRVGEEFNAGQADAIDSGKIGTEQYEETAHLPNRRADC